MSAQNYLHKRPVSRSALAPKANRFGWVVLMLIGVGMIVMLYSIKAQTLAAKARVDNLERARIHEMQVVRILTAEIAHLESPERLKVLATEQLGLAPTKAAAVMSLSQAAQSLPKKQSVKHGQDEDAP